MLYLEDFRRELNHYQQLSQLMKLPRQRVICQWHFSHHVHRWFFACSRISSKRYFVHCLVLIPWWRRPFSNVHWNDPIPLRSRKMVSDHQCLPVDGRTRWSFAFRTHSGYHCSSVTFLPLLTVDHLPLPRSSSTSRGNTVVDEEKSGSSSLAAAMSDIDTSTVSHSLSRFPLARRVADHLLFHSTNDRFRSVASLYVRTSFLCFDNEINRKTSHKRTHFNSVSSWERYSWEGSNSPWETWIAECMLFG